MDKKNLTTEETFSLAVQNQQKNNLQIAKNLYKETLKINPNYVDAHNNLGIIFQALREFHKARNCYEKLLNLDPSYKKGYSGYGNLLLKISQHNKGLAYIKKGDGVIRFSQKDVKII